jgi:hypothetical protein
MAARAVWALEVVGVLYTATPVALLAVPPAILA